MDFKIKKGLNLPILGAASDKLAQAKRADEVALLGSDYIGMKPTMLVKEGDKVQTGQPIFSCKKNIGLTFTSPATGTIKSINRGDKRVFQSMVIATDANDSHVEFSTYKGENLDTYKDNELRELLIQSGMWAAFRQRPFDKVADIHGAPSSIFVTAIDTNPLAPKPEVAVQKREAAFEKGLFALSHLIDGNIYVCLSSTTAIHTPSSPRIKRAHFDGPHPAGNAGTHIHMIDPVNPNKHVWHIGYQDVIALGHLIKTGQLLTDRIINIAGPFAKNPEHIETRIGAKISSLVKDYAKDGARVISGSILHGHTAAGAFDFLGRYSNQVTLIEENAKRELLGWHSPGFDKFSIKNIYVSKMMPGKKFNLTSNTNGSLRAMVPVGMFEQVMPLDILPTQLLRALASDDTDSAQDLGCLELAEEDVALLTYASPGKVDFGPLLRKNLTQIEKEG